VGLYTENTKIPTVFLKRFVCDTGNTELMVELTCKPRFEEFMITTKTRGRHCGTRGPRALHWHNTDLRIQILLRSRLDLRLEISDWIPTSSLPSATPRKLFTHSLRSSSSKFVNSVISGRSNQAHRTTHWPVSMVLQLRLVSV